MNVVFWCDVTEQLPKALHILLSDQGHRIEHIHSISLDSYSPIKSKLDAAHDNGSTIIVSGISPIKMNIPLITSFKDNRFKIFFLDDDICSKHHSQQAACIILRWGDFINNCTQNTWGSRVIFPLKRSAGVWKRVEDVLNLPPLRL